MHSERLEGLSQHPLGGCGRTHREEMFIEEEAPLGNLPCHHCFPANWGPSAPPTKTLFLYSVQKKNAPIPCGLTCFNYQRLVPAWLFLRTFALRCLPLGNFSWMFFEPQTSYPTLQPSSFSSQVTPAARLNLTVWKTRGCSPLLSLKLRLDLEFLLTCYHALKESMNTEP